MSTQLFIDLPSSAQYIAATVLVDSLGNPYVSGGSGTSTPASSTVASVAGANTDVTLLAANTARKGAIFYNTGSVAVNVLLNSGVSSATNYSFSLAPTSAFTLNAGDYVGIVKAFWNTAANYSPIQVTELF